MSDKKFRVVFMGCPDFAVPSLQALIGDPAFDVVAVYCMPDRPKGRGKQTLPTPVKQCATRFGLEVNSPASFRKFPEEVEKLRAYHPDFLIVVAYGLILPQDVLDIPTIAPINVHASLLPAYRGPSPIHHALLNGDKKTGNTIMLMNSKMDEGDIIAVSEIPIEATDNLETLHDKLCLDGAKLLIPTLKAYAAGKITATAQDHSLATYTGKISPQTAQIDWNQSAEKIANLIRAMSPFPGAWFLDGEERIKVFKADTGPDTNQEPGRINIVDDSILVSCGSGTSLYLQELQRPGKSRMPAGDFLRGYQFKGS